MPFDGSGNYTRSNGSYFGTTLWQQKAASASKTIDAAEHDAEMNDVATALSTCITKTGLTLPSANLPMNNFKHTGCANATNPDEYATYSQLTSALPTATMVDWPTASAPTGWLLCDGAAVSRATYLALFTKIGTLYGAGDGATTFNLPDCRGRFTLGVATAGTGSTLAGTGGSLDHTHSVPAHYHGMGSGATLNISSSGTHTTAIDHNHGAVVSGVQSANHTHSGLSDAAGTHDHLTFAGAASNHIQPYNGPDDVPVGAGSAPRRSSYNTPTRTSSDGSHQHSFITGNESGNHQHTTTIPALTQNSASTGAHTHGSGDVAGLIGKVTGGVDGNAAMTTGTTNPAFIALNKIIKY